jgi:hypothetical protein
VSPSPASAFFVPPWEFAPPLVGDALVRPPSPLTEGSLSEQRAQAKPSSSAMHARDA